MAQLTNLSDMNWTHKKYVANNIVAWQCKNSPNPRARLMQEPTQEPQPQQTRKNFSAQVDRLQWSRMHFKMVWIFSFSRSGALQSDIFWLLSQWPQHHFFHASMTISRLTLCSWNPRLWNTMWQRGASGRLSLQCAPCNVVSTQCWKASLYQWQRYPPAEPWVGSIEFVWFWFGFQLQVVLHSSHCLGNILSRIFRFLYPIGKSRQFVDEQGCPGTCTVAKYIQLDQPLLG